MSELSQALAQRTEEAPASSTVGALLDSIGPQLDAALAKKMDPARFARVVLTEVRKTPQLMACDPRTLLGAVLTAAQLGLEPGPLQLAYLIPRKNKGNWEVQFQLGYRGMIELALRGGRTGSVDAHVVREGDEFAFEYGTNQQLRHVPLLRQVEDEDTPRAVAVYAVAKLASGGAPFTVLDIRTVERRRARGAKDSPAWRNDWDSMARKTAVRELAKFLPQTPELAAAQRLDETTRTDLTAQLDDLEPDYIDGEAEEEAGERPYDPDGPAGDPL